MANVRASYDRIPFQRKIAELEYLVQLIVSPEIEHVLKFYVKFNQAKKLCACMEQTFSVTRIAIVNVKRVKCKFSFEFH